MKVSDIVDALDLDVRCCKAGLDRAVTGGYASDLLSDVIGNARAGDIWVTLQTHQNVVAVAMLKELAAVVLVQGRAPDDETVAKAEEEGVPVLVAAGPTFDVVGRLYDLGIRSASHA